eukprot:TRINITY_DN4237_c0_g1_i1.p3 TRINITY_DN4237_c0_g1~~TRINITY_DN4237_c0_g1_i1.p3  ORF type:complete len:166 (+),score=17.94 TRINITY_DN4237_c0_g1_i1:261-758(+)
MKGVHQYNNCLVQALEQNWITFEEYQNYHINWNGNYQLDQNLEPSEEVEQCMSTNLQKYGGAIYTYGILWVVCWICASVPVYVMCCCTKVPRMANAWRQLPQQIQIDRISGDFSEKTNVFPVVGIPSSKIKLGRDVVTLPLINQPPQQNQCLFKQPAAKIGVQQI